MGLLKSAAKVATAPIKAVGKAIKGVVGGGSGGPDAPGVPEIDPRLKEIAAEQRKAADEFKANLPAYKKEQFNVASDKLKRGFAQDLSDIDTASNRRGLLYSGMRQGARAQAQGDLGAGLAGAQADINQEAENQARQMEMQAIQTGMGVQSAQMDREKMLYQMALDKYGRKKAGQAGLLGAAGMIGGAAFGGGPAGAMVGGQLGSSIGGAI